MNHSTFTAFVNILSQRKKEKVSPEGNSLLLPEIFKAGTFCYLQKTTNLPGSVSVHTIILQHRPNFRLPNMIH